MTEFKINKKNVLSKYIGKKSHVVIPDGVIEIGNSAFQDCEFITSIKIPNTVKKISDWAFWCCKKLSTIEIPNSVTEIGYGAFSRCTSLSNIKIPNSVTSIDNYAFFNCTSLTNIKIPNSMTRINFNTFSSCTGLTHIEIPSSMQSIGSNAFYGCTNIANIEIPNNVSYIGSAIFRNIKKVQPQSKPNGTLRAFKAFEEDWKCRAFKYKVGETYHQDGEIECCKNGFHACPNPLDVFNHYWGDVNNLRFAEVELSGEIDWKEDKVAASDIKIVRELTYQDLFKIYNSMEKE